MDFWNATNADPDRNASSPAFVYSLSRQHCLIFQLLGLSRAIGRREDGVAIQTNVIQFEEAKVSQLK
jgi:hypothetical protein